MKQDQKQNELATTTTLEHNPRKPHWWRQLSRRGTKAQRRTIAAMKHYIIPSPGYGDFIDWNEVFDSVPKEIWFELGFGLGDNLLFNAQLHKDKHMVGAEVHSPGVASVLKRIQQAQEMGNYWAEYTLYNTQNDTVYASEDATSTGTTNEIYSNVRIYHGNGMKLLRSIPTSSLSAVLLTFPDPFPHESHREFRLLQVSNASDFYRVLNKSEGRLYLATDHVGYFEWCLSVMKQCRDMFTRVLPVPDRSNWLPVISKYEQKGYDEGRETRLACWQVVAGNNHKDNKEENR